MKGLLSDGRRVWIKDTLAMLLFSLPRCGNGACSEHKLLFKSVAHVWIGQMSRNDDAYFVSTAEVRFLGRDTVSQRYTLAKP